MLQKLKKRESGFTIIEVLIVLAIAGLIMLIVFLAVPALQRSSRNRGRENDASLLATAINDCVTNNNGKILNCQVISTDAVDWVPTNANQLTGGATYGTGDGDVLTAKWHFGNDCEGGGTARSYTVRFKVEGSSGEQKRCVST